MERRWQELFGEETLPLQLDCWYSPDYFKNGNQHVALIVIFWEKFDFGWFFTWRAKLSCMARMSISLYSCTRLSLIERQQCQTKDTVNSGWVVIFSFSSFGQNPLVVITRLISSALATWKLAQWLHRAAGRGRPLYEQQLQAKAPATQNGSTDSLPSYGPQCYTLKPSTTNLSSCSSLLTHSQHWATALHHFFRICNHRVLEIRWESCVEYVAQERTGSWQEQSVDFYLEHIKAW